MIGFIVAQATALVLAGTLLAAPAPSCAPCGFAQQANGRITVQWLGWSEFRITSANGTVIVTDPVGDVGPAAGMSADALAIGRADVILLTGAEDEASLRNASSLAVQTLARIVAPPALLAMVKSSSPSLGAKQLVTSEPGGRLGINGLTIRMLRASPPPASWVAPASVGYLITFETGQSLYFAGATSALDDQAVWAQTYQPALAILDANANRDPRDIALQIQLLQTGNPNLTTVLPHHYAYAPTAPADAWSQLPQLTQELASVGLASTLSVLAPGQVLDPSAFPQ